MSHALVALALGPAFRRADWPPRVWWVGALCAVLPDADVLGFFAGVPMRSMLGHRGLTHSFAFAVTVAGLLAWRLVPSGTRMRLWLYLFLATASHGVLDAMTNGGIGIAFLAPFHAGRYYLPWRPIAVSPLGVRPFFTALGVEVLASEARWIWGPSIVVAAVGWFLMRPRASRGG